MNRTNFEDEHLLRRESAQNSCRRPDHGQMNGYDVVQTCQGARVAKIQRSPWVA